MGLSTEAVALLAAVGAALFCDFVGFKYKVVTYFVLGGVVSLLGLANLINDASLTLQHDLVQVGATYSSYTITAAGDLSSMSVIAASLAVFCIAQFLIVIERQTKLESGI